MKMKRWICSLICACLVPVLASATAATEQPTQAPAGAEAAAVLDAFEDRLLKAGTVRLDFHATAEGAMEADLRGALHIGPADQVVLTASGSFAGKPVDVVLRSEPGGLQIGSRTVRRPDHLKEALVIGFTRMGILHNLARLTSGREPDHANGGVRDWVTVGAFGRRARPSDALVFQVTVAGRPAGSASLEIDASGRPVLRRQTVKFPSGEMRVTERYAAVTIDP